MFEADIYWEGQSGKDYGYWVHRIGTSFNEVAGNFIYAKLAGPNEWLPVFIGQTDNLNNCAADQEKYQCARQNGATHIHIHTTKGGEASRVKEAEDLVSKWSPPCNGPMKPEAG